MPTFTDRELDIMAVLWSHGPSTAAEVRERLAREGGLDLAYNTVLTMLRILEDKGHVGHEVEGRAHRFRPLVAQEAASRSALRRLVDGLFNRSPELLLSQLVRDERLDRAALERLRELVDTELAADAVPPAPRPRGANRRSR